MQSLAHTATTKVVNSVVKVIVNFKVFYSRFLAIKKNCIFTAEGSASSIYEPSPSLPALYPTKLQYFPCNPSAGFSSVTLVNQVYNDFHHHVFLFCLALCNHQSKSNEGVICQTLGAVFAIENAVII